MKSLSTMIAVTVLSVASVSAYAEQGSGLYIGLKSGVMEPDASGVDLDDDNPIIVQGGIDFRPTKKISMPR